MKIIVYLLVTVVLSSCVADGENEELIPGLFVVDLQDSIVLDDLNLEEELYYSDLELRLFSNKEFKLTKSVGSIDGLSGFWSYEGARLQKQLYLNFSTNIRVQIGVCEKPGDVFFFPITNSIDENGMVRKLKFIKLNDLPSDSVYGQ